MSKKKKWSSFKEQQTLTENFRKWVEEEEEISTDQDQDLDEAGGYLGVGRALQALRKGEYGDYLDKKRARDRANAGRLANLPEPVEILITTALQDQGLTVTDEFIAKAYADFIQVPQVWKERYPELYPAAAAAVDKMQGKEGHGSLASPSDSRKELAIRNLLVRKGITSPDLGAIRSQIAKMPEDLAWWDKNVPGFVGLPIPEDELQKQIQTIKDMDPEFYKNSFKKGKT